MMTECPKCNRASGDDWSQCDGECPIPGSPHYIPSPAMVESDLRDCLDDLRQALESYGLAKVVSEAETGGHRTWQTFNIDGRCVTISLDINVKDCVPVGHEDTDD